jgi:hypothetical protein
VAVEREATKATVTNVKKCQAALAETPMDVRRARGVAANAAINQYAAVTVALRASLATATAILCRRSAAKTFTRLQERGSQHCS